MYGMIPRAEGCRVVKSFTRITPRDDPLVLCVPRPCDAVRRAKGNLAWHSGRLNAEGRELHPSARAFTFTRSVGRQFEATVASLPFVRESSRDLIPCERQLTLAAGREQLRARANVIVRSLAGTDVR